MGAVTFRAWPFTGSIRLRSIAILLVVILLGPAPVLHAQLQPPSSGGAVALAQALRFLGHNMRVLVIGAHPDDEDTELLTILTRQYGAEAAYLSLNRGEGGQNLIGPELGVGLGILRSEETLSARRLDGAQQFFTRAYDFGYSKSLDDTWAHWPRDLILDDVVRVVRAFRPQVIVSIFSGTPRDGHGQHQAAGWLAAEAFRVAGDPSAFPQHGVNHLRPWLPTKLYRSTRFDSAATTLVLAGGGVDLAEGKTYHQIAMASRSRHRSQDMGQLQTLGSSAVRLRLVEDRSLSDDGSLWSGIDTTMAAVAIPGTASFDAAAYEREVARLGDPGSDAGLLPGLVRVAGILAPAVGQQSDTTVHSPELRDQFRRAGDAWLAASGTVFDVRADRARFAPGDSITMILELTGAPDVVPRLGASPSPWPGTTPEVHRRDSAGRHWAEWRYRARVGTSLSQPYYLWNGPPGNIYRTDPPWLGHPFEQSPLSASLIAPVLDKPWVGREASYRWNDQGFGERREPVEIVPRVAVTLSPGEVPWRRGNRAAQTFTVTLVHGARDTTTGTVALELPAGWTATAPQPFVLSSADERQEFTFSVRAPAGVAAGRVAIRALARDAGGSTYDQGRVVVDYPHIRPRGYLVPATAHVTVLDLTPPPGSIAYIRGAGDMVPEALEAAGLDVDVLPGSALASGNLARYSSIVVGPRAYEVDPGLVRNNHALLAYVRAGGRVVVQYQQYGFFFDQLAPLPLFVASRPPGSGDRPAVSSSPPAAGSVVGTGLLGGHDRVTDEAAPVTILREGDRILTYPNRIGPADWQGWVQERGLYFARAWAPEYRVVVAMHDPGEAPLEGGLLVAAVGKGTYVYTGLSFFRQLPAGVPGAFRLFANLLAARAQ